MARNSVSVGAPDFRARDRAASVLSGWRFAILLALVAIYYLFLLSNGDFELLAPELLDQAFNSMLMHLLHGEFTVDNHSIGFEGFIRDGKTYTYFGVFPAFLRLVALPFTDLGHLHFARLSCLTAVVIFVALQLKMLLIVDQSLPAANRAPGLLAIMILATVLSGPQLYILGAASIYLEPLLWSAALAAAFNVIVLRAALGRTGLRPRELTSLAVLAGLALSARVSIGIALYLGTVLLVLWTAWRSHRPAGAPESSPAMGVGLPAKAVAEAARGSSLLLPFAVLAVFGLAVAIVNYARWGNPLTFANFDYYFWYQRHPEFLAVLHKYGEFNVGRVWIGAIYYATGVPYLLKTIPPFAEFLNSRIAGIEAPPFSPLLTNPLTVIFASVGLYRLFIRPQLKGDAAAILRLALTGHAAAVLLILAAMAFTMRYRFDFAPFMTLAALVGYRSASIAMAAAAPVGRKRLLGGAVALCVLGILGSHYILLVHKVWSIGAPMAVRRALLPFAPFADGAFEP